MLPRRSEVSALGALALMLALAGCSGDSAPPSAPPAPAGPPAKAAPAGCTLFLGGVASHGINPNLHARLGYDPVKDFAPVSLIASAPLILVVHPSVPVKSVQELIQLAKANTGTLTFASNGTGGSSRSHG